MKHVIAITRRVLATTLSDIKSFMLWLLFPLVFTFIFGVLLFGGNRNSSTGQAQLPISVTVQEDTALAGVMRQELGGSLSLSVSNESEDKTRERVQSGQAVAGVIVPAGFERALLAGQAPEIIIVRQEQSNLFLTAKSEVTRCIERVGGAVVAANAVSRDQTSAEWKAAFDRTMARWHETNRDVTVTAIAQPVKGRPVSQANVSSIGFCIMFVMLSVMVSSGTILEERTAGTWQRLLAAPASRLEVLCGYLLGFFITGWLQFAILMVSTRLLFGMSWGDPVGLILLSSLLIIAATAIGLAIAGVSRSAQQQSAMANIGVVVTSMIAGVYWPYEMMPKLMQQVGKFLPQYWAMQGYKELLARGRDFTALGPSLLVLGAISVVLLAFGVSRIKFE